MMRACPWTISLTGVIIERANEQYEKEHEDDDCDCGNARTSLELVNFCKMELSGGDGGIVGENSSSYEENTVLDVGSRVLSPIDEDLKAGAVNENKSEVIQAGDHLFILTEDGDEICEAYTVKLK